MEKPFALLTPYRNHLVAEVARVERIAVSQGTPSPIRLISPSLLVRDLLPPPISASAPSKLTFGSRETFSCTPSRYSSYPNFLDPLSSTQLFVHGASLPAHGYVSVGEQQSVHPVLSSHSVPEHGVHCGTRSRGHDLPGVRYEWVSAVATRELFEENCNVAG
jgi:hypothetical protein